MSSFEVKLSRILQWHHSRPNLKYRKHILILHILSLTQKPTRSLNYLLHATSENMNTVLYLVHASSPLNLGRTFQISETCYKKCPQHSSSVIAHLPLIHLADCWPHALAATHLLCTDASRFHMFITSRLCPNIMMQMQTNP
jgi:hypothetical protein